MFRHTVDNMQHPPDLIPGTGGIKPAGGPAAYKKPASVVKLYPSTGAFPSLGTCPFASGICSFHTSHFTPYFILLAMMIYLKKHGKGRIIYRSGGPYRAGRGGNGAV
jgi:hypothetical protein